MNLSIFKTILCCTVWLGSLRLPAQDRAYDGPYKPTFTVNQSFNGADYLLGFSLGVTTPQRNLMAYTSFDFRPYRKKLQQHIDQNLYYQYAERRLFTGLGLSYMHRLNDRNHGVFADLSGNYTWGTYGGTNEQPDNGFVLIPRVGFFGHFFNRSTFVRLGYEYLNSKSALLEHRLFLSLTGVIRSAK